MTQDKLGPIKVADTDTKRKVRIESFRQTERERRFEAVLKIKMASGKKTLTSAPNDREIKWQPYCEGGNEAKQGQTADNAQESHCAGADRSPGSERRSPCHSSFINALPEQQELCSIVQTMNL